MGGHGKNGNRTKGNKGKKNRRRVNPNADIDDGDRFGRIYKNEGQHVTVELPTENEDGNKLIKCRIPGKMWKKIWFNKGDLVVVAGKISDNVHELKGKVSDSDVRKVKRMFESTDNNGEDIGVLIGGDENEDEQDHDDMILGVHSRVVGSTDQDKKVTISTKKSPLGDEDSDSDSIGSIDLDDL
jgi:translation initiation factor IF-1